MRNILKIWVIYTLAAFLAAFFVGFFSGTAEEYTVFYRMLRGVRLFCEFLPSVLISAFVVGTSVSFGKSDAYVTRFSAAAFRNFRHVVLISFIAVIFSMFAAEAVIPLVSQYQRHEIEDRAHYEEYIALAEQKIAAKQYTLALLYLENALAIFPESKEAQDLHTAAQIERNEMASEQSIAERALDPMEQTFVDHSAMHQMDGMDEEKEGSYELLAKSRIAYDKKNWFQAHSLAQSALSVMSERDPNYAEALRLSSDAWNQLAKPGEFKDEEEAQFFARKREGYNALMNDEPLKSYYIFRELIAAHPRDADIITYYAEAMEKISFRYFFIDEMPDLKLFERIENVHFSFTRPDGGLDIVYIRGVAALERSGRIVQYLRQLSVYSFDQNGEFEMSYTVPYAKMYAQAVSAFDDAAKKQLNITLADKNIPLILLEGIDRESKGVVSAPVFSFARPAATQTMVPNASGMAALEMGQHNAGFKFVFWNLPYDDLLGIIDTSAIGPESMSIPTLFRFIGKGRTYGFSDEVLLQVLLSRLTFPLILMILMIAAATIGWEYRLASHVYFKFLWIFLLPPLTLVMYALLQIIMYAVKLCNYAVINFMPTFAAAGAIVFSALSFALFLCIAAFLSRRNH